MMWLKPGQENEKHLGSIEIIKEIFAMLKALCFNNFATSDSHVSGLAVHHAEAIQVVS